MRRLFSLIFIAVILALTICAILAKQSRKPIGRPVMVLDIALIPPVLGNLIIVYSSDHLLSLIGCYMYYMGMNLVMAALMNFIFEYCHCKWPNKTTMLVFYFLLLADNIQYFLNPIFGQAFEVECITVDGFPYYRMIPHIGQIVHRVLDFSILAVAIVILIVRCIQTARIFAERYYAILAVMLVSAVWQTSYMFSRAPIERAMIGYGLFGVLIYYFAIIRRPTQLLDRMLANVASEMPEAMFFFDANERCIWANAPGIRLAHIEGGNFFQANANLLAMFGAHWKPESEWTCQLKLGNEERHFRLQHRFVKDEKGRSAGAFLRIRDFTEEEQRRRRELYNATHDALTGLYTREYLYERIQQKLRENLQMSYQVVFINVKNFKLVNDIFNKEFGDHALRTIAKWVRTDKSENCVYGRIGGDTFGVLVPVEEFNAEQLEEELGRFVVSDGNVTYRLLIHLGVYKIVDKRLDVAVMFDRAHLALSSIRDEYQTHIAYYDNELRSKTLWAQQISAQLYDAIQERHLRPYLQPIVNTEGKVVGCEALARWIHPKEGFLSPAAFIPVFEKNGMIVEVDRHMWRCACEILDSWKGRFDDLFISVNISPKDFFFIDVFAEIKGLVKSYNIDPAKLRIEITETVMMNESDDRMRILSDFRKAGFVVEMDDFGSGYSSLNLLKDMPVDVLKIDMKFLSRSDNENRSQTIVQNIINLSDDLGISALTEGVETEVQYKALAQMRCKLFQGYYFAKPLPQEDFESFCERTSA